jgi:NAD(P)-dependent dehydrogenase (short-subunit alcohol dehydrogenase family)
VITLHSGNVGFADDCRRLVAEVLDRHGHIDILVNNAGITIDKTHAKLTDDDWHEVLAVRSRTRSGTRGSTRCSTGASAAGGAHGASPSGPGEWERAQVSGGDRAGDRGGELAAVTACLRFGLLA